MSHLTTDATQELGRARRVVDLRYRWPARYRVSVGALVAIGLIAAVVQPNTYKPASLQLMTATGGCLLVASLGEMLVVMVGAIDLSVPSFMTLSAAINVHYLANGAAQAFTLAIVICVAVSAFSGALIGFLRLNSLIVTLAVNTIINAVLVLWMGQSFSRSGAAPSWLQSIGRTHWINVSAIFFVAVGVAALTSFVLYRTRAGRRIPAVGVNRTAARIQGIRINLIYVVTFAVAGALYAIAGALTAGFVQVPDPTLGDPYQLATVTAVAIAGAVFAGGPASVSSLVAACLLLQVLNQALTLQNLSSGVSALVMGFLLVLAVSAGTLSQFGRRGYKRLVGAFGGLRSTA